MNRLFGTIEHIKSANGIMQVFVNIKDSLFSSLILSGDEEYEAGKSVHLLFKETEVMIASKESLVSARNSFVSKITHIESGEILSQITFDFDGEEIVSIITKDALHALQCKVGDDIRWFVKSNEVSLQRV